MSRTSLIVVPSLLAFLCACSSGAGAPDPSTSDSGVDPSSDTGFSGFDSGSPFDTGASSVDTGAGGHDSALPDAGSSCTPKPGEDLPDDEFADTNCDGIDGDVSKAIFVAPSGVAGASGAIDAPMKTLGEAITKAASAKKSVYVCNGTFSENVTLTATTTVNIYGGYDCASAWKRIADRAHVSPTTGTALVIDGAASDVVIDRIAFESASVSTSGASSIAVFVKDASGAVTFRNAQLTAGDGASGGTPTAPTPVTAAAPNGADGQTPPVTTCLEYATDNPIWCSRAAAGGSTFLDPFTPPGCAAYGGAGGKGGVMDGAARQPGKAASFGAVSAGLDRAGIDGADGSTGAVGSAATSGLGTITSAGYVASNVGNLGAEGQVGGGASGGAGSGAFLLSTGGIDRHFSNGGGGGEGGAGGCGGPGGGGGGAGGASIALLVKDSPSVSVVHSTLSTGAAGNGGDAGAGGVGQPGGAGGHGGEGTQPGHGLAYSGGHGGRGGTGGSGGAGGGGPSLGIFYVGATAPTATEGVTFNLGSGGKGGHGRGGVDGADGVTTNVQASK